MRHGVRYSHSAYLSIDYKGVWTQKEAVEFAERIQKQYRYIWLSEYGEYKTAGGNWVESWIDYWWSPPVTETDWGACPDAGWGQPADRKYLTRYRPLLYRGSRAHLNVRASATAEEVTAPPSPAPVTPSPSALPLSASARADP